MPGVRGRKGGKTVKSHQRRSKKIDLAETLRRALSLHRSGRLLEAEHIYRRLLRKHPGHPDILHFFGVLSHQAGRSREAVQLIAEAVRRNPNYPDAYNNLGNVLKELGKLEEAESVYRQAIAVRPEYADAYNNLGTVLRSQGRDEEAVAAYERAIALDAGHADAHLNLGNVLKQRGEIDAAIDAYVKAISLKRYSGDAYRNLGFSLYAVGRVGEAAGVYRRWLSYEPGQPAALHMLAACTGQHVPVRASDEYVRQYFDHFADSFDAKLASLDYSAPRLVCEAMAAHFSPARQYDVLDAGCGTGLCGPLLRPYARHLVGVDLSPNMLAKARARHLYDELVPAELADYMSRCSATYDLVVSADTLVYFGPLQPVLEAAVAALRPGGCFVFSLERLLDADQQKREPGTASEFRLNPHGRYSHAEEYVRSALETVGLAVRSITAADLRIEKGEPVPGLVVVSCRA